MDDDGGRVTTQDLAEYRAIERVPIVVDVGEWQVATNPAPAVGGATLAAMLMLLEEQGFTMWDDAGAGRLAEVQQAVLRYRDEVLDVATDRAAAVKALLDAAAVGDYRSLLASPSTVHVSAVDGSGLGCAITTSAGYGSGLMVPGTGLWLNNSLGEIELLAGDPADLPVGSRMISNMAPTVARRRDGAVLSVGSPGASRITTAIAQVLVNFIHLGMSLSDAVAHPRLHVEVFEGEPTIAHEPGVRVTDRLGLRPRRFPDLSMYSVASVLRCGIHLQGSSWPPTRVGVGPLPRAVGRSDRWPGNGRSVVRRHRMDPRSGQIAGSSDERLGLVFAGGSGHLLA